MVTKVVIRDNENSPVRYIDELENFKNGKEYVFKPGINIIVGKNGSGKTTLLKLIRAYLLVDETECRRGVFNSNINNLFKSATSKKLSDGVDVYADYKKNTFRLCHVGEKSNDGVLESFDSFGRFFEQQHSSTGECVHMSLLQLFEYMFSAKAKLEFDYEKQFEDNYQPYVDYVKSHRVDEGNEYTIIMDEPDRNLDIDKVDEVCSVLSYRKKMTQTIVVVHNPLLIYKLSQNKNVNFIEMTEGYVDLVKKAVEKTVNGNAH